MSKYDFPRGYNIGRFPDGTYYWECENSGSQHGYPTFKEAYRAMMDHVKGTEASKSTPDEAIRQATIKALDYAIDAAEEEAKFSRRAALTHPKNGEPCDKCLARAKAVDNVVKRLRFRMSRIMQGLD